METKVCGKCKQEKLVSEFYKSKRDGYRSRCIPCGKEDCREYAQAGYSARYQRDYSKRDYVKKRLRENKVKYRQRPEVRIKNMARWYTGNQIRAGKINREPCAICGKEQGEAHHLDYNQPLAIVWLCPDCHRNAHLTGGIEDGQDTIHYSK